MKKSELRKQIRENILKEGTITSLLKFRLYDRTYGPEGNPKTLIVYQRSDNTLGYSLYGGWQNSGMGFSMSNLQLKNSLPSNAKMFTNVKNLQKRIERTLATGVGSHHIKKVEVLNDIVKPASKNPIKDAIALLQKSGYTVTKN